MALRNSNALIILVQICTIMLIFCFAGCAAISCATYGHSCWGGHGKRNDIQSIPTMRLLKAKTLLNGSPQNNIVPFFKTQWILSRLITGQPILPLAKYQIRGSGFPKDKSYVPSK